MKKIKSLDVLKISPDKDMKFLDFQISNHAAYLYLLALCIALIFHAIILFFIIFTFPKEHSALKGEQKMIAIEVSLDLSSPLIESEAEDIIIPATEQQNNDTLKEAKKEQSNVEEQTILSQVLTQPEAIQKTPLSPKEETEIVNKKKPPQEKAVKPQNIRPQKAAAPNINVKNGDKFSAPTTTKTNGENGKAIAQWQSKVQRMIALTCRKVKLSGNKQTRTTYVTFSVNADGAVFKISLSRSSGDASADQLALDVIRKSAPFPKPPLNSPKSMTIPVTIK